MSLDISLYTTCTCGECTHLAYSGNITHNLGRMAERAGLYDPLWRPEELGVKTAYDLIEPIAKGLELLKSAPVRFSEFNASNGWGTYEQFVPFVEEVLAACFANPNATIEINR